MTKFKVDPHGADEQAGAAAAEDTVAAGDATAETAKSGGDAVAIAAAAP